MRLVRQALQMEYRFGMTVDRREEGTHTHIDSLNPFRLLADTKRPPFFPYNWRSAGVLIIETRYVRGRPNDHQSDGEETWDPHGWAQ